MAPISEAVGWVNIAYISGAASLGWFVDYRLFVAATSWVHYLKYIHQYYFRAAKGDLARYKAWQRDVLLYKTIALLNLAYIYFGPHYDPATGAFDWSALDAVSLAVVIAGYFISISATQALGIDGTCESFATDRQTDRQTSEKGVAREAQHPPPLRRILHENLLSTAHPCFLLSRMMI